MPRIVELETTSFENANTYMPRTASEAVSAGFIGELKNSLGQALLMPGFASESIIPGFHEVIERYKGQAITTAMQRETNRHGWEDEEDRPLHRHLGSLAIQPDEYDGLTVSDIFMADLHTQLDSADYDFTLFDVWHEKVGKTGILNMAATINEAYTADPGGSSWIRSAYELVQYAAEENPAAFTIETDDLDALYLITFMPYPVRGLLRRMITGNVMTQQVGQRLGDALTEPEREALKALKTFYSTDALSGQQWDDLLKRQSTDDLEDISIAISLQSSDQLAALGRLQNFVRTGEATRVSEAWIATKKALDDRMGRVMGNNNLWFWQLQDIGHCFNNFNDWDLQRALDTTARDEGESLFTVSEADKSGRKALILEDDVRQAANTLEIVNAHTPFTAEPGLCFEAPEEIGDTLRDPEIGLFVIDIQNGSDNTAGIRIARDIVAMVLGRLPNGDRADIDAQPVRVIVWSASAQAVRVASDYFKTFITAHPKKQLIAYSLMGSGYGGSGFPLKLDVHLKRAGTFIHSY